MTTTFTFTPDRLGPASRQAVDTLLAHLARHGQISWTAALDILEAEGLALPWRVNLLRMMTKADVLDRHGRWHRRHGRIVDDRTVSLPADSPWRIA